MPSLGTLRPPPNDARMEKWIGRQLAKPLTKVGMVPWRSVGQSHEPQRDFSRRKGMMIFPYLFLCDK